MLTVDTKVTLMGLEQTQRPQGQKRDKKYYMTIHSTATTIVTRVSQSQPLCIGTYVVLTTTKPDGQ